jgi:hypothetical protein
MEVYPVYRIGFAAGVEETPSAEVRTTNAATIVRGVLLLSSDDCRMSNGDLLDVSGRKVMRLKPGANDVSGIAPGVYFVREEPQATSPNPQAIRKVVVTR